MTQFLATLGISSESEFARDLLMAVVIVIVTAALAHVAAKALRHLLDKDATPLPSTSLIVNVVRGAIWAIGISVMLDACFDVNVNALVTALGVGGVALSLGLKDTLSNFIGGLQMTLMGIVVPGDHIEVGGDAGVVQDVNWRHTTISNRLGETVVIPNSVIATTALVQLPPAERVSVPFAVTGDAHDMRAVKRDIEASAKQAAESVCPITEGPHASFSEITEYGFKGKLALSIDDPAHANDVIDAVITAIAPMTRRETHAGEGAE
ncbi:mechanosensitive ion channel family protein [Slackia exigua]|uniref:Transporter, small conductance mechanosensitive ion channel MscS family protein n=1 Tax=Slackia exigua (strain ATCC 700122 / DSM 15923 / CIP 105133 / JCM 11022 / KCTC 5966 / S-7) TaxID=649764 RepID=D0WGD6_SLAES|nr:mechanosensitive ion channel domain-containing protein [Slackia exigua]EEZ61549.1 transporter, small conductance mechanosensitive ion channel MscS family protein [Slackia exigua ATCC 700122]MCK6138694.1 mechanosensitive ion channel family protein [Slackia exigua]STN99163.1 Small-conductance mechanosensitive channel [Slackia exigua]